MAALRAGSAVPFPLAMSCSWSCLSSRAARQPGPRDQRGAEDGEGVPTVFLFDDTQIVYESFLEDVNLLLNTGEVPNLFVQ